MDDNRRRRADVKLDLPLRSGPIGQIQIRQLVSGRFEVRCKEFYSPRWMRAVMTAGEILSPSKFAAALLEQCRFYAGEVAACKPRDWRNCIASDLQQATMSRRVS